MEENCIFSAIFDHLNQAFLEDLHIALRVQEVK